MAVMTRSASEVRKRLAPMFFKAGRTIPCRTPFIRIQTITEQMSQLSLRECMSPDSPDNANPSRPVTMRAGPCRQRVVTIMVTSRRCCSGMAIGRIWPGSRG